MNVNLRARSSARSGDQADEKSDTARRPHHQQRFDIGPCAPAQFGALHGNQARHYRANEIDFLDGRKHDIACSQIDIGNAATDMTSRMADGVPQADGTIAVEPRMDVRHVADAVLYIANLPLDVNVQFITVMATKMPLVGRG